MPFTSLFGVRPRPWAPMSSWPRAWKPGPGCPEGRSTLPFVPLVVDLVGPVPVRETGGIAGRRGAAAALGRAPPTPRGARWPTRCTARTLGHPYLVSHRVRCGSVRPSTSSTTRRPPPTSSGLSPNRTRKHWPRRAGTSRYDSPAARRRPPPPGPLDRRRQKAPCSAHRLRRAEHGTWSAVRSSSMRRRRGRRTGGPRQGAGAPTGVAAPGRRPRSPLELPPVVCRRLSADGCLPTVVRARSVIRGR